MCFSLLLIPEAFWETLSKKERITTYIYCKVKLWSLANETQCCQRFRQGLLPPRVDLGDEGQERIMHYCSPKTKDSEVALSEAGSWLSIQSQRDTEPIDHFRMQ